jgi:hypothetical protein
MHVGHALLLLLLTAGSDPIGPDRPARGLPAAAEGAAATGIVAIGVAMQSGAPTGANQAAPRFQAVAKSPVDDLLDDFSDYYEGDKELTIVRLRRP